jgi:hypothetical protein
MNSQVLYVLALTAVCAIGIASGQSGVNNDTERTLLLQGWNQYMENLNYSSDMVDLFMKKNITNEEAMHLDASLMTLNAYTISAYETIQPSDDREKFHGFALEAMNHFQDYLFNMGKFFETNDGTYLLVARDYFNQTQDSYVKGKAESEFSF